MWPDGWIKSCLISPQKCPKSSHTFFTLYFINSFGLLLWDNMLPRTCKNSPIWSHCTTHLRLLGWNRFEPAFDLVMDVRLHVGDLHVLGSGDPNKIHKGGSGAVTVSNTIEFCEKEFSGLVKRKTERYLIQKNWLPPKTTYWVVVTRILIIVRILPWQS